MEGLGLRFVANRFDVVPVRTNDESCIVVRMVVRVQTRHHRIATRLQSRAIESFDLLAGIDLRGPRFALRARRARDDPAYTAQ